MSRLRTPAGGNECFLLSVSTDIATGMRDFEVMCDKLQVTYAEAPDRTQSYGIVIRLTDRVALESTHSLTEMSIRGISCGGGVKATGA